MWIVRRSRPLAGSKIRTVPSWLPSASRLPSGLYEICGPHQRTVCSPTLSIRVRSGDSSSARRRANAASGVGDACTAAIPSRIDSELGLALGRESMRPLGPCRVLRVLAQHECPDPSRDGSGEQYSNACQQDPQPTELAPAFGAAGRDELALEPAQLRAVPSRPIQRSRKPGPAVELGTIPPACLPLA